MLKSLIGRISRWVRRTSSRYCTIELDKDAQGLAKCLVHGPLTKEEKAEKYREQLLRGIRDENEDKVIDHFNDLSREIDPYKDIQEIPDNSVKKVGIDISVEDVQTRTRKVYKEKHEEDSKKSAENAIKGLREWPISIPRNIERKRNK